MEIKWNLKKMIIINKFNNNKMEIKLKMKVKCKKMNHFLEKKNNKRHKKNRKFLKRILEIHLVEISKNYLNLL